MPLSPQEMRALFPIATRYAYLDHAANAPLATPVRSTMEVYLGRMTEEPFDLSHWERLRSQVRTRIAELLSVGAESITFTKNTTAGLGLVAAGLDWEAGDIVMLPIKPEGTTHQHVNADPERPARLLVAEPNFVDSLGVDLGAGFEQVADAPPE